MPRRAVKHATGLNFPARWAGRPAQGATSPCIFRVFALPWECLGRLPPPAGWRSRADPTQGPGRPRRKTQPTSDKGVLMAMDGLFPLVVAGLALAAPPHLDAGPPAKPPDQLLSNLKVQTALDQAKYQ